MRICLLATVLDGLVVTTVVCLAGESSVRVTELPYPLLKDVVDVYIASFRFQLRCFYTLFAVLKILTEN